MVEHSFVPILLHFGAQSVIWAHWAFAKATYHHSWLIFNATYLLKDLLNTKNSFSLNWSYVKVDCCLGGLLSPSIFGLNTTPANKFDKGNQMCYKQNI